MHDWNGNGHYDSGDRYIDYRVYEDVTGGSGGTGGLGGHNGADGSGGGPSGGKRSNKPNGEPSYVVTILMVLGIVGCLMATVKFMESDSLILASIFGFTSVKAAYTLIKEWSSSSKKIK